MQGIEQLVESIQLHRQYLLESGVTVSSAQRQVHSELQALIMQAVTDALKTEMSDEEWDSTIADITRRERDPYTVASEIQARIGLGGGISK